MDVQLTPDQKAFDRICLVGIGPDQKAFAQHAIDTGRLHHESEAVQEALALWEHRERTRAELLAELDQADASLARGEGRIITEQSMVDMANKMNERGRARLVAEQAAHTCI